MTEPIVEMSSVSKYFDDFCAVDRVSYAVDKGSVYGVLGPNGAGKTTCLRIMMGIIEPDSGHRRLLGSTIPQKMRSRVGYLPEERGLYSGMKVRDSIAFLGALRGLDWSIGRKRAEAMLAELDLSHVMGAKVRTLSKGMAQMVQLVGSIVHQPEIVVLDEPFSGLDPVSQERLEGLVRQEQARGATIIFSTHVMAHAEQLCDRLAIIARSKRRFEGTVDEARARLPKRVRYQPNVPANGRANGDANAGDDSSEIAAMLPDEAVYRDGAWHFSLADAAVEDMMNRLSNSKYGIRDLSIVRPSLHDAFVDIIHTVNAEEAKETAGDIARAQAATQSPSHVATSADMTNNSDHTAEVRS